MSEVPLYSGRGGPCLEGTVHATSTYAPGQHVLRGVLLITDPRCGAGAGCSGGNIKSLLRRMALGLAELVCLREQANPGSRGIFLKIPLAWVSLLVASVYVQFSGHEVASKRRQSRAC